MLVGVLGAATATKYVSATCPYSAAALKTGKITCTPGGYTLSGAPGQTIVCSGHSRVVTSGGQSVPQPNSF
jgi:hypothetical protein